ncbi:MAG TPA: signal peptidase I [Candidatus Hydrogenedentes bacterium]|nr:signal peptidase I [Candidatus Hydrogenedentota bacterium]
MSEPTPDIALEGAAAKPANIKGEVGEVVKLVVWFLALFFVLKAFVIEGYEVQGPSMEPTLQNDERILVFKLSHKISKWVSGYQPIQPGDIVVFERTEDAGKRYVKRVIAEGLPRQSGNTVDAHGQDESGPPSVSLRIEDGRLFVNNQFIEESYLPDEKRDGFNDSDRAELKQGQYYVMGDNRGVSKDSRAFGPIEDPKIIGKAVFRFWPLSRFGLLK